MKKSGFLLLVMGFLLALRGLAITPDSVGTKKIDGKNFIIHRVEPSEGWFNIARSYGISYADLRLANKDSSDKLEPGNLILVPTEKLKPGDPHFRKNYTQREQLFYDVKEGETLFSIARKFDTSVDSIKSWNALRSDVLKADQRIIVGFRNRVEKQETVTHNKLAPTSLPVAKDSTTLLIKTATEPHSIIKGVKKPVLAGKGRKEITETGVASWIRDDDINPNKYYALHRSAPPGTIIKVKNKMNNKYVFVKVVGVLPDAGDNTDLIIKISKASAEKLGIRDLRFQSELSYGVTELK